MTLQIEDHTERQTTNVFGAIAFSIPERCRDLPPTKMANCPMEIGLVDLYTKQAMRFFGKGVSKVRVLNPVILKGTISTIGSVSIYSIPTGAQLYASGDVEGYGRIGNHFTAMEGLVGFIDWKTRTFQFLGNLTGGSGSVLLLTQGQLPNLPPHADPGSDRTLECSGPKGTPVTLSGTLSRDPDGPLDLKRFTWSSTAFGEFNGKVYTPTVPLGTTSFTLKVADAAGKADQQAVNVTVRDTKAPKFRVLEARTNCLWPADNKYRLLRLGKEIRYCTEDACDPNVKVRITGVRVEKPIEPPLPPLPGGGGPLAAKIVTPPIPIEFDYRFGPGAVCLRAEADETGFPRTYGVRLELRDSSGNVRNQWVKFWVPDSLNPPTECRTGSLINPPTPFASPITATAFCSSEPTTRVWGVNNTNLYREAVFAWHLRGTSTYGLDLVGGPTLTTGARKLFGTPVSASPDVLDIFVNGALRSTATSPLEENGQQQCGPNDPHAEPEPPADIFPIVADDDPRCRGAVEPSTFLCSPIVITPIPIE